MRRDSVDRLKESTVEAQMANGFPGAKLNKGLRRRDGDWVARSYKQRQDMNHRLKNLAVKMEAK